MAKALAVRHRVLRENAREIARVGCLAADLLRLTTANERVRALDNAQHYLRACLLEVEEALREWRDRRPRRREWIKRCRQRIQGGPPLIGEHLKMVEKIETALAEQRQMVRQLGDGLAWVVLREDPRIIYPLFAERPHHLTPDTGLAGATQVIIDVHKGGELLVLDNDLTRCLGSGDLTVVRADGRWSMPLSVECKTLDVPEELEIGSQVTVNMSAPVSSDLLHQELHDAFTRATNANVGRVGPQSRERVARQEAEMTERAEGLLASLVRRPQSIESASSLWGPMRKVLNRALQTGAAYDVPEVGLALAAIRNRPGDASEAESLGLLHRLQQEGFPKGEPFLTIADLSEDDRLSAVVPPIALWPLPREQRAALLSGDMFLACVFGSKLWETAFENAGLTVEMDDGSWVIRGNGAPVRFDPLERVKLRLGIAFGGVSPRAVAEAIADVIRSGSLPSDPDESVERRGDC